MFTYLSFCPESLFLQRNISTKCKVGECYWMCLSGECLFQRGEVWISCRVLQQRHGCRRYERAAACQQSHGLPQAREVSTSVHYIFLYRVNNRSNTTPYVQFRCVTFLKSIQCFSPLLKSQTTVPKTNRGTFYVCAFGFSLGIRRPKKTAPKPFL